MRLNRALALAGCALVLAACAVRSAGETARSTAAARGVVTLVPSFADDVVAIGAGSQLVAVSAFTDAPQTARLPRVADASSVDDEAIVALRPRVVIGIPAQARLTQPLLRAHVRVVLLADNTYASIFGNLKTIGRLTGRARQADATIARLTRETAAIEAQTKHYARRPSVFMVLGAGPIWTAGAGSYLTTLIALAGGTNAANDLRGAYGVYSAEALVRRQPDLLVADAAINLPSVLDRQPWRSLSAVRAGRVYVVNPNILERPGPRYNDGLRWLVARIKPLAVATR